MTRPLRHYVTACRAYQLPVLLASMRRHCQPFRLHALCWDFTPDFAGDDELWWVSRWLFERRHPDLFPLPGEPRSTTDAVCSVRWTFALDVMLETGQPVTLIDGDLWFTGDPDPAFQEIGDARAAVTPHGFAPAAEGLPGVTLESHGRYGRFNAGFCYFADPAPLAFMAEACRAWCETGFLERGGRRLFGDQGHLEVMAEEFGAHVIRHPGVNVGPWNVHRYPLPNYDGPQDLISYHYSSLRFDGSHVTQLANPEYEITHEQIHRFYDPYVRELEATHAGTR